MNINKITENPSLLFKSSFVPEELSISSSWESKIEHLISTCCKEGFSSGVELLTSIEQVSQAIFSVNTNNLISTLADKKPVCSELLGSMLMCLAWLDSKKTFPKVILSSGLYYFVTPDGDITQVNSNRKSKLEASEKFELFSSDKTIQFNFVDLVKHYFEEVCAGYIKNKNYESLEKAQTYMISFDPREVKWYARRGLLLKRRGKYSEALTDLKRFLSFCTYEDAPQAVKTAIIELEGLKAIDNFSEFSIH